MVLVGSGIQCLLGVACGRCSTTSFGLGWHERPELHAYVPVCGHDGRLLRHGLRPSSSGSSALWCICSHRLSGKGPRSTWIHLVCLARRTALVVWVEQRF